jgi:hypothetical protein
MSSIAEVVTKYQSSQKSYERAVARAGGSADAPWTGKSIAIAGRAVAAAGNAVQTARLVADAREKLGPELTEKLLDAACTAATLAAEAANQAGELTLGLISFESFAQAGDRTREASASIAKAIKDTLKSA